MTWKDGSWDRCKIDGEVIIGRVADLNVKPERDIQVAPTPGTDGPPPKDQGYKGSPITLTIEIWRASMANALIAQLTKFHPRQPGTVSKPHTLEHPIATAFNIQKWVIASIEASMPKGGLWTIVVSGFQWFPGKKKTQTAPADGGPLDFDPVPPPDPKNLGPDFP